MIVNSLKSHPEIRTDGIYNTEPYHLEKYVVPGAVAVALLFIFPWYLLGGKGFGGIDLGAAVIAVLVIGHIVESLKVYQWGRKVRENFKTFNARVEGLLAADGVKPELIDRAKAVLFSRLDLSEISGFSWNLVRWQKMTVFAVILCLNAFEWFPFASLALLDWKRLNPFATTFRLIVLREGMGVHWSILGGIILALIVALKGWFVYKYGLGRQVRNNDFFFQLFLKYREEIVQQLTSKEPDGVHAV